MKFTAPFLFCLLAQGVWAGEVPLSPVGRWQSIDDKTGDAKAEIRINETGNGLSGRIEKRLKKDEKKSSLCEKCTDDRQGQPLVGLEIIRGGHKKAEENLWEGGKILDPENGREYRATFKPIEEGKKLEVRGYFGPFWRTQTWRRIEE